MKRVNHLWESKNIETSSAVAEKNTSEKILDSYMKKNNLTTREIEVLGQLREGHSYKKAAEILRINIETVRKHVANIYNKLEAKNRTQALKKYFG